MNNKINAYLDMIFADIPKSKQAIELKAELSANLNERMNDYMSDGKSENQAYSMAISSLGDVDELLNELSSYKQETVVVNDINKYRERNAKLKAVATALLISSIVPLFLADILGFKDEIGLVIMFIMAACAIAIFVYINSSTPAELVSATVNNEHNEYDTFVKATKNKKVKEISSFAWTATLLIYFILVFFFSMWSRAWALFPITGISLSMYKTILRLMEDE